jgi:hypothetical protein
VVQNSSVLHRRAVRFVGKSWEVARSSGAKTAEFTVRFGGERNGEGIKQETTEEREGMTKS